MFLVIEEYFSGGAQIRVCSGVGNEGDDRPHYGGGWALRRDLHEWLVEHGIEYKFHWARSFPKTPPKGNVWEIEVLNPEGRDDDILLFKLKFL